MPRVRLRLRGQLADSVATGGEVFEVAEEVTLEAFLLEHGLGARHYVVMLNTTVGPDRTTVLKDGDLVTVYPQMAGG
ncbi:MAG: MoaD/ThiS family protein [Actinomycetota bacterium]|nr:MoaD/ThiS family protein [Actinomycetota bacterium]